MMKKNIFIIFLVFIVATLFSIAGCNKKEVPVLETNPVTDINATSAVCGGNIIYDGGETVLSRGVCWSTNTEPSIKDVKTSDGAGAGTFSSPVTNLKPATNYYIRAYATTSSGTGYGMVMSFKTLGDTPTITTQSATNVTASSVTLIAFINANYLTTNVSFEYGTSIAYGTIALAAQSSIEGNTISEVRANISGLTAGTTYHFRVKSENPLGVVYGIDMVFTTFGQAPAISNQEISNLQATSAIIGSKVNANYLLTTVTFEYGPTTSYGSSINASPNTFTGNSPTYVSAHLSGLNEGTTYHFRTVAINSLGASFGTDMIFIPSGPVPVADIEGNVYPVIVIGAQTWMAENLRTTKYNDNTDIPLVTDNSGWIALTTPGYCWYNNDMATFKNTYGGIYNFYAVNTGKLCPSGWHVPSDDEFTTLTNFLGGINVAGGKIKEAGTNHWTSPNTGATNESGFTALPGGQRDESANFIGLGLNGVWWTSTPYNSLKPWYRSLGSNVSTIFVGNGSLNIRGFSVRCLRN
jgi:uncharacterized protein (TIGR02145 family)